MESRRLLVAVLLIAMLSVMRSAAQVENCGYLFNISSTSDDRIFVNRTIPQTCFQCMNNGMVVTNAEWIITVGRMSPSVVSPNTNELQDETQYMNGILVVRNFSDFLIDGSIGDDFTLLCVAISKSTMISSILLAQPSIDTSSLVNIMEGEEVPRVICTSNNFNELVDTLLWVYPDGTTLDRSLLPAFPARREATGDYKCVVTGSNQERVIMFTLIVQFAPEITPVPLITKRIQLNGTFSASCSFVGVPIPNVIWTQNSTVELNESDPSVSITTGNNESALMIFDLGRDGGGIYSCVVNNSLGSPAINVTNVFVLVPPAPVLNLTPDGIGERHIEISWRNGFDGFSPITGARIEYSVNGSSMPSSEIDIPGSNPTSFNLTDLVPFTNYTISVFLENMEGRSDPVSIVEDTLSLILEAPINVMLTPLSSTKMELTWDPPAAVNTTDPPDFWIVRSNASDEEMTTTNTTTVVFPGLLKGTVYQASVAGSNVRGTGAFSPYISNQTNVDPPSEPLNVMVDGISSKALDVEWMPPTDDGGRPVQRYRIEVLVLNVSVMVDSTSVRLRDIGFMQNTTYNVRVVAENVAGTGDPAFGTGTTLPISDPQPVLDMPVVLNASNISACISWTQPGGDVTEFIIKYEYTFENLEFNVTVSGNTTKFILQDLNTTASYTVTILTRNDVGVSAISSPLVEITTLLPPDPVIIGPGRNVEAGTRVELVCISPDNREIKWFDPSGMFLNESTEFFDVTAGVMFNSTLIINNVQVVQHSGVYICRVGDTVSNITLTISFSVSEDSGIDTIYFIIAGAIVGVGLIILLIGVLFLLVCYCRYKNGTGRKKSSNLRVGKRTNDLFEVSNTYTPMTSTSAPKSTEKDTAVSFSMPTEYEEHSSFNTLDKPEKRSESPELANPTSFGGNRSSKDATDSSVGAYQDMPSS